MGTIADKLTYLGQTKAEIREAIILKGVTVPAETTFREYAGKILEITTADNEKDPLEWVRPADWLPIENKVVAGDQKFVGLYAVLEDSNFISLAATADYTVDWGDGVVENFASGVTAYHTYSYGSFEGTETTGGCRQAIVTITPQAGQNLTGINLQRKHKQAFLNFYSSGWMDIRLSGKNMTSLAIGGSVMYHGYLEAFCFLGNNAMTDFRKLFQGCSLLQSVSLSDTSNGTNFTNMFASCTALEIVPLFDTSNGTDFSYMFRSCTSLQKVPLFDTGKGLFFTNMFASCAALKTVPLFNTSNGVSFNAMFLGCTALRTIPLFDTSKVTGFIATFLGCTSLRTVPLLNTVSGTEFNSMFFECTALRTVPLLNTVNGTDFSIMFHSCGKLDIVPALNTSNGTNLTDIFINCGSLSKAALSGTKNTITYANSKLSQSALVDIFNNLASGVTSKTVTITNNWGSSLLTAEERAIATNKGWTIVG